MDFLNDDRFLLLPMDLHSTHYQGYIKVKGEEFEMEIRLDDPSSPVTSANVSCEWRLKELLSGYEEHLQNKLSQCTSLENFLSEVAAVTENVLTFKSLSTTGFPNAKMMEKIYKSIQSIGWNSLSYLDKDLELIKFCYSDCKNRNHVMAVQITDMNSKQYCNILTDLPVAFNHSSLKLDDDLKVVYENFVSVVNKFQEFWNVMDYIDSRCWVLEPEVASKACSYRRLALGKNLSIHLNIDPYEPNWIPDYRFIGAKQVADKLKDQLKAYLPIWDKDRNVLENITSALDIDLPRKDSVTKEDVSTQCGICYSYLMKEETPDDMCDDRRCGQPYHNSCLVEWLRSRPSFRQSFNIIFGECPYCKKSLSIRVKK